MKLIVTVPISSTALRQERANIRKWLKNIDNGPDCLASSDRCIIKFDAGIGANLGYGYKYINGVKTQVSNISKLRIVLQKNPDEKTYHILTSYPSLID